MKSKRAPGLMNSMAQTSLRPPGKTARASLPAATRSPAPASMDRETPAKSATLDSMRRGMISDIGSSKQAKSRGDRRDRTILGARGSAGRREGDRRRSGDEARRGEERRGTSARRARGYGVIARGS